MTRNQLLPNYVKKGSGGVMFTVDGTGNITPTTEQLVNRGEGILTQHDSMSNTTFSGQVCARQGSTCQCSALVGVSSGSHMAIDTGYTVSSSVAVDSEFEIYAVTDSGPVAGTTNGTIRIGG